MAIDSDAIKRQADIVQVIQRVSGVKLRRGQRGEWSGLCPIHGEKNPSFSASETKQIFNCLGCGATGDVFDFIEQYEHVPEFIERVRRVADLCGLSVGDERPAAPVEPRIVTTYKYVDEEWKLLYEVVRYEPKNFKQRRPDGNGGHIWGLGDVRRPLYRLPEIIESESDVVWWVEGEKDVHTLESLGMLATTASGGAKAPWQAEWGEVLRGRRVVVIPDNDTNGIERGHEIQGHLRGIAARVVFLKLPNGCKDATEFVAAGGTRAELEALFTETLERGYGLLSPAEVVDRRYGITAFLDPTKRKPGIFTGFADIDEWTNGLHGGELILLGGRPAMGKTSLAMNIVRNVAERKNAVAVFSLEMASEQLMDRMICSFARVDYMKFRKGWLDSDERRRVTRAHYEIAQLPFRIDDTAAINLKVMRERLELMIADIGLALVVVDYLQLMGIPKMENRNAEVSTLSRGLKLLAKELNVPFLALAQLSRQSDSRPGNRPQLSDLRDSGSLEQDADMVGFVHRPEIYKPDDSSLKGLAEFIIAKQRNGPIGIRKLTFVKECTLFTDYAFRGDTQ